MDALPSLPSLTPDDRYWRVDWFGECAYPGSVRRYAQPSIRVSLSQLNCDPNDHAALLSPDCTDYQHQHEVWPPVAALPLLAIGDIWHEGRHVASPDYQVERFKGLRITSDTSAFVKAGLALDEHFLLPLGQHPWHRNHTQSYCVAVTLGDGRRLLVPCVELIRFYFGSSSNLLQRLFTAPLRPEKLWASKRLSENRHLHLVLANGLSGASAADIGRVAESGLAWRAAAGIYASCQKATAQRHPAYPYTGFPFEGTTDLEASGLWLPFGDRADATFLVYRLRSCSFPFPFHSLSYEASDRKMWRNRNGGEGAVTSRGARNKPEVAGSATDDDPGGTKKAQHRGSFHDRRQFTDLARKQVWREKIEAMPKADVFLRHVDGSLEQVAFGEGDGCTDAAGVDACKAPMDSSGSGNDTQLPRFVSVALEAIAASSDFPPDAQLVLLRPTGKQEVVFSLPMVVGEDGEIADRLLYSGPDGRVRQRRACFVEIRVGTVVQRYVLVAEGAVSKALPTILSSDKLSVAEAATLILHNAGDQDLSSGRHK